MSKYTPGPWTAIQCSSDPKDTWSVAAGENSTLAKVNMPGNLGAFRNRANAQLMATAPNLVQTLLGVRTDLLRTDFRSEADRAAYMIDYIERALVKAGV